MKQESRLLKPILNKKYELISHARGVYLYTTDGKEFLDGCSGAINVNIGHGVMEIADIAFNQIKDVSFVYRTQFSNESAEKLAIKLVDKAPGMDFAFFVNSGSEATEGACRLAIQHWQEKSQPFKQKILSRKISYHGTTFGALSISGHFQRRYRFNYLLHDIPTIETPYCFKCPFSLTKDSCGIKCAYDLEKVIKQHGSDSIAAFIVEPIVGASGAMITPPDGYYQIIKEICDKYNILFIVDEVMTGLGRTGRWFAIEHWNVEPDIIVLGKGMSAGYSPIASILASKKVMQPLFHGSGINVYGHTYSGNPLSAAISLGVINFLEKKDILQKVNKLTAILDKYLENLQKKYPIIKDIRGKGLLKGLELEFLQKSSEKEQKSLSQQLVDSAYREGLLIYPSCGVSNINEGEAIIIAPPLTITEKELSILIQKLEKAFQNISEEIYYGI
ncbi:aspartate aminotransferase family protein [Bacillaceae bacterium Marseille-Q3522]|nr:aspartate aminotransferase family protein [Bacillaceae bacterium Marseille-Q3522]